MFELPSSLRDSRWAPSRSAALGVVLVVAVVAAVFGVRVWLAGSGGGDDIGVRAGGSAPSGVSRGTSTLARASPTGSSTGDAAVSGGSGDSSPAPPGGAVGGMLVVHVVGQVARPGVYTMAAGARVADAVKSAGGATRAADLAAVNLARMLVDGEQVVVPKPGESVPAQSGAVVPGGGGSGSSAGGGAGGGVGGKVSLNSADLSALDTLPGVGPVLAQRILDWRTEHGRFTAIEELGEVSGIGEKLLAQLTPKVTL